MLKKIVFFFLFFSSLLGIAKTNVLYTQNCGQWDARVLYKANFYGGAFFAEKNTFTVLLYENDLYEKAHHSFRKTNPKKFNLHALKFEFINANNNSKKVEKGTQTYARNYFLGNDTSKWKTGVKDVEQVIYTGFYKGIDLKLHQNNNNIEFDFVVSPNANSSVIAWKIAGANRIKIVNNSLVIYTSVGNFTAKTPVAYQTDKNGNQIKVDCTYTLNENNEISFLFPKGYNKKQTLVIDPELVFSTFTGSVTDNWGFCATYDLFGNAYAGGIAFGSNYPTTTGAFQTTFAGGSAFAPPTLGIDISISVFSADGTTLLYSTLLGGANNEMPLSMVANKNNEILILSRTYSSNFPTTENCFDNSFNGMSDIGVTRFKKDFSALIASTFIGGTAEDGVNVFGDEDTLGALKYNYGDDARGEIQIDDNNNVYFVTSTKSVDFPINGFQNEFAGVQDAIACKLNANLSQLLWSTYLGGEKNDAGYALFVEKNNDVLICGGTESTDIPKEGTGTNKIYSGGIADGFICRISADCSTQKSFTYIGTNSYDQTFFVQQDRFETIYVFGQTKGVFPIFPSSIYNNPNSGLFIQKFSSDLNTVLFSTTVGSGRGVPDLVPSAFSADKCDNIYLAGWGGSLNGFNGTETFSIGMPTTSDAYQASSDSSDFYFMVLDKDATSLIYATYFGGKTSEEHVDGGTSRFDKNGFIYQAICAGCGGNSDMPTTANAWSVNNKSSNCNNAIVKFEFDLKKTIAEFLTEPLVDEGCAPFKVDFQNYSKSSLHYEWNFGDGTAVDSSENTFHNFETAGEYTVQLISKNPKSCNVLDTAYRKIIVHPKPDVVAMLDTTIRSGDEVKLWAHNDSVYYWYPPYNTSCEKCPVAYAKPDTASVYYVNVFNKFGCTDMDTVNVNMIYVPTIYIPNCFTPNENDVNEIFSPKFLAMVTLEVIIYNRWGDFIYSWNELNGGWNGKVNGVDAPQGVYIYELIGIDRNGKKVKQTGNFTLLR